MKVKLLKKIRKRFVIEYYPNRDKWHVSKQSALNDMLNLLRWQYQSRSRKYKVQNIKTKVWHNG